MSLFLAIAAAASAQLPSICTDRPAKANAVCTVPAKHWQVEASIADWTRTKDHGPRTSGLAIAPTTFKYGLTGNSDFEVAVLPYARLRTAGQSPLSGPGDTTVRYKRRLSRDGAPVQVSAVPFVKMPTAKHGLGNGKAEWGVAAPISVPVAGAVTMTFGPEADWLANADGHGRHLAIVNLVNLTGSITGKLTLAGELWSNRNFDPSGTIHQASADMAAAYAVSYGLQLDAGANLGLTRETADIELYSGISVRF